MNWLITSIHWYLALLLLGIIFIPLTKKVFGKIFYEFGYPFAKVLAILFLSYTAFVLGTSKILAFTQSNLFLLIILFLGLNLFLIFRIKNRKPLTANHLLLATIFFEELLFLASFLFWVYVRGQEPSIRGLEKFMDFGFINSVLRSKFFPPLDIWLPPNPINYYYFGHLAGALLIRLTGVKPAVGYNLLLATIFALGVSQIFSFVFNICYQYLKKVSKKKINIKKIIKLSFFGLVGSFIVNLGGNLHTIYLFTSGYPNEAPIPFWQILGSYSPLKYWYPNATRFIPFTIHEFPSYSYVVADLHGHVFDIPFVLLTLAILFKLFINFKQKKNNNLKKYQISNIKYQKENPNLKFQISKLVTNHQSLITIFLAFLTAILYMTNAFDGPIYLLLIITAFFILFGPSWLFFIQSFILTVSFLIYSLPFSLNFTPFISGIGVNCSPKFLTKLGKIGPFLFEKNNCQISPPWMLFILWGFFWVCFLLFILINKKNSPTSHRSPITSFIFLLFAFGTFLIIIPEFFYIKDIYPAHFRANTMFKLGYQAFIMMGVASAFVFFQIKFLGRFKRFLFNLIFVFFFFFIAIYPSFSIPSYYGNLKKPPELDGGIWLKNLYPEDEEIVDFLNTKITGQPVILEAQGDSYTDYERISANTGLPTVAGWWVHEWLWRGSSEAVGERISEIENLYQSDDIDLTKKIIKKYRIKFVIIAGMEKEKYANLNYDKFNKIGKIIFHSQNYNGLIYQLKP